METRANYTLIGLFTLSVIVAGFGFVYWFHRGGSVGERATYQVVFDGPVSGLRTGAAVVFNGIRIGEVSGLALNATNPRQVIATIAVSRDAPVRADTRVSVQFQGLTGIATLALRGGSADAPALQPVNGRPAVLKSEIGTGADLMSAGSQVLQRLEEILVENQVALRGTIKNLETFTASMVKNTERLDRIMASAESAVTGVDTMINGKDGKSGEVRETILSVKQLSENLDKRTGETLQSFRTLAENLDKRTADTIASIQALTDNVDKRVDSIATNLTRFSGQGLRNWEVLAVDARRAVNQFERAVRNFDRNPSRIIWGGSPSTDEPASQRRQR